MMHEMYEQENIDVLFLGSSHCYRSIVPEIMDREMNVLTFNGGTSSQQPVASYYLLKEAAKEHKIDRVYMELYYDLLRDNKDYQSPTAVYIISDYMKASWNKLQFLWDTGGKDYLAHGLFYGRREWSKLFEPSSIMKNIRIKNSDTYWNYAYVTAENEAYTGKGFVYNYEFIKKGEFASKTVFPPIEENAISDVNKMWLDKMILFCKKNDIELVFYTAPVPDFRLAGCGNYDEFGRQVKHFLEGKDVPYYDFNLCKADFMKMEDEYFKDDNHLNGNGAEIFSLAFAHFFTDNLSSEEVFWESYEQKLENSEERVFGVICEMQRTEDGTMEAVIEPVTNMEDPPYLAVYKRRETEENYQLYREYSIEKTFKLPANEYGYIHIYVSGDPESKSFSNDATFYYGSE
ncbi:MAG: hypothetical protein IKC46_15995 [Lachnospiraceae bacterium]|nr:hypothetical protein [Lachnospiraceae bacterium]